MVLLSATAITCFFANPSKSLVKELNSYSLKKPSTSRSSAGRIRISCKSKLQQEVFSVVSLRYKNMASRLPSSFFFMGAGKRPKFSFMFSRLGKS